MPRVWHLRTGPYIREQAASDKPVAANGPGTVFSITTSGTEKVLYSFQGDPDGAYPVAGLVNVKDMLCATTWEGGATRK
jgi:uncharacterized repeat protein (TIGR03803 family)